MEGSKSSMAIFQGKADQMWEAKKSILRVLEIIDTSIT
jgi:hypothetical protein